MVWYQFLKKWPLIISFLVIVSLIFYIQSTVSQPGDPLSCTEGQTRPCGSNVGACIAGMRTCVNGQWSDCTGGIGPSEEICNGLDDNCNGQTDEVCECTEGQTRPCGSDVGACEQGTRTCINGFWGECTGGTGPTSEICDGIDNDCDDMIDENCVTIPEQDFGETAVIEVKNKANIVTGSFTITRTTDGYDISVNISGDTIATIKQVESVPQNLIIKVDRLPDPDITSEVFAIDKELSFSSADIKLKKTGTVRQIAKCEDFDVESFSCPSSWVITNISFTQDDEYIYLTVNSFSAIVGTQEFSEDCTDISLDWDITGIWQAYQERCRALNTGKAEHNMTTKNSIDLSNPEILYANLSFDYETDNLDSGEYFRVYANNSAATGFTLLFEIGGDTGGEIYKEINLSKYITLDAGVHIRAGCLNDANNEKCFWDNINITSFEAVGILTVSIQNPTDNQKVKQNKTFTVNATVTCLEANCGTVAGAARYNATGPTPDTEISTGRGDLPLYVVSPLGNTYENQTDGFGVGSFPLDITSNGTDFWIIDSAGDVTHWNGSGVEQSDNFSTGINNPRGIVTNGTDFWVTGYIDQFVYHFNSSGDSQSDDFYIGGAGAGNPRGITTNGSDFWITDMLDKLVYHFDKDGNFIDSFSLTPANPSFNPRGITTNGTDFWVVDWSNDFVYHFNSSGDNQSDAFYIGGAGSPDGITTELVFPKDLPGDKPLNFWVVDSITNGFVYHLKLSSELSCGTLNQGESCQLNWTVNATELGSYEIDVNFSSDDVNVESSDTEDRTIVILPNILPTHSTPIITPYPTYFTDNITCTNQSTYDEDGDTVTNVYTWQRDNDRFDIAHYSFDVNVNTTIRDYAGNDNDLTIPPCPECPEKVSNGKSGPAYYYNGSTYLRSNSTFTPPPESFTMCAWIKPDSVTTKQYVMGWNDNENLNSLTHDREIYVDTSGNVIFRIWNGTDFISATSQNPISLDWNFVCGVQNGYKHIQLYINGDFDAEGSVNSFARDDYASPYFGIGKGNLGTIVSNIRYFNGTIDQVTIYNRTLTPQQIQALYSFEYNKIMSQETTKYQEWTCEVTPNDAIEDGQTLSNSTIIQNSLPTHSVPIITPDPASAEDNITCTNQSTFDPDGDSVTNIYNWLKDGKSIAILNMPFDTNVNDSTPSAVRDYSGYDNDGTIKTAGNPTWIADGKLGGAYNFSGQSGTYWINVSDDNEFDFTTGFTVQAWIKPNVDGLSDKGVVSKWFGGTSGFMLYIGATSVPRFYADQWFAEGTTSLTRDNWYLLTGVWNTTHALIYVNGAFENSAAASPVTSSNDPIQIGTYANRINSVFNGVIDEIKIFNITLSPEQIYQLYIEGLNSLTNNTIVSQETIYGQNWTCQATPNDAIDDGVTKSDSIITGNLPPTHDNPIIVPSPTNTTDNITCINQSTFDPNEDPVTNIYNWLKDGKSIAILNMPFDTNVNDSTPGAVRDYSGVGNNGTLGNDNNKLTWVSNGKIGGAYYFNGNGNLTDDDDYIIINDSDLLNVGDQFTIMLWFNAENWPSGNYLPAMFSKDLQYLIRYHTTPTYDGCLHTYVWGTTTNHMGSSFCSFSTNTWYHIALVYNSTHRILYINGTYDNGMTDTGNVDNSIRNLTIGAHSSAAGIGTDGFNGTIDEVRLYNISLTPEQIYQHYTEGLNNYTNSTIVSQETANISQETPNGQNWTCQVTPNDATYDGITKSNSTIIGNTPPTHSPPVITPYPARSADNIACSNQSTLDINGDPITNIYNWLVDGTSITVLNMPFETNISDTTSGAVRDYSGYDNNGTLNPGTAMPTWTPSGKLGGAFSFDGNDYFNISNSPSLNNSYNFTVTVWIKPSAISGAHYILGNSPDGGISPGEIFFYQNNDDIAAYVDGPGNYVSASNVLTVDEWRHVALVMIAGQNLSIYINGSYINAYTGVTSGPFLDSNNDYYVGSLGGLANYFNGTIDELKIFNISLTPKQINQLYIEGLNNLTNSTIVSQETTKYQEWTCEVTPNDAIEDGQTLSNSTMIQNSPPTHSTPTITPYPTYFTDNITCTNQSTYDEDGDSVTNIYNWLLDGTPIAVLNMPFDTGTGFFEGFESGFGNWQNATGDDCEWFRNSGTQNSSNTGPDNANTGTWYVYTEASSGYCDTQGDKAQLESSEFETDSVNTTLSFWYHMYGADMGSLRVDVYNGSWNLDEWSISGQQHTLETDPFTQAIVDLSSYSGTIKVRFRGIRGASFTSDMALDDITIYAPSNVRDYSGYGNDGSITNVTWTNDGKVGGAYVFDGGSYISTSLDIDQSSGKTLTMCAWAYPYTSVSASLAGDDLISTDDSGYDWAIDMDVNGFWRVANGSNYWQTTYTVDVNTWQHLCAVFDTSDVLLYKNGASLSQGSAPGYDTSDNNLMIGKNPGFNEFFNGTIDEVRIYNRTLTSQQIYQLYIDGLNNYTNSTIVIQETSIGQNWTCEVTPNDAIEDGQTLSNSTIIYIPVTCGETISSPGEYKVNLSVPDYGGTCITINVSDVALDCQGYTLDGVNIGYGIFADGASGSELTNITIENCVLNQWSRGIYFDYTDDSVINNANISNSGFHGISFNRANNDNISSVDVSSSGSYGLYLSYSNWNIIDNSTFREHTGTSDSGVYVYSYSDYNQFINNNLTNNYYGLYIYYDADLNNFSSNRIIGNSNQGINISSDTSDNNRFWNNLINNTNNHYIISGSNNFWNTTLDCSSGPNIIGDPCIGGNYWSNYTEDGFSDTCTDNGDGICDDNYTLDSNNIDYRPLTYETAAPSITTLSPENKTYNYSDTLTLNYTVYDFSGVDTCWYNIDNTNNNTLPNCQNITLPKQSIGSHTLYLFANDTVGNLNNSEVTFTINNNLANCTNIEHSGVYYLINEVNNYPSTCIKINVNDVELDCQGYKLDGVGSSNTYGVFADGDSGSELTNVTIKNCTLTEWNSGVYFEYTNNSFIDNVNTNSNTDNGINLRRSNKNELTNINSTSNNIGIDISYANYNNITNVSSSSNNMGLNIQYSDNNILNSIFTLYNNDGLRFYYSDDNNLTNIFVSSNTWYGLYFDYYASRSKIENSTFINNSIGIYVYRYSDYNQFINNNVSDNSDGISLAHSSNNYNNFSLNIISNNSNYGIYVSNALDNRFWNNVINNTNNYFIGVAGNDNFWNTTLNCSAGPNIIGGDCIGGNYWSNYTEDGFSDTCTDSNEDGICDDNYTLNSNNIDYLPLTYETAGPEINLLEPIDYYNTTSYSNTFVCNVSDLTGITNVSLYANWSNTWHNVETNSSGLNNVNYSFTLDIRTDYQNQTDGFSLKSANPSFNSRGIATNGTDFWVVDLNDDFVYHFNSSGDNVTGGFNASVSGADYPWGMTTNGTDFWIVDITDDFVYHFDKDGNNITDGFSIDMTGEGTPYGITTNGTDFWVAIRNDEFLYHFNSSGDNQSDGFDLSSAGITHPYAITSNGSDFWIIDGIDKFVYHFDKDGNNLSDRFNITDIGITSPVGIVSDKELNHGIPNNFWIVDNSNKQFTYHLASTSDGVYSWNCRACDTSDNCAFAPGNRTLTIDGTAPDITLNYPPQDYVTTSPALFNATIKDSVNVANVTLWGNWSGGWHANETNPSGFNNIDYIFTKNISEGVYIWAIGACDLIGNCDISENRTITISKIELSITKNIIPDLIVSRMNETINVTTEMKINETNNNISFIEILDETPYDFSEPLESEVTVKFIEWSPYNIRDITDNVTINVTDNAGNQNGFVNVTIQNISETDANTYMQENDTIWINYLMVSSQMEPNTNRTIFTNATVKDIYSNEAKASINKTIRSAVAVLRGKKRVWIPDLSNPQNIAIEVSVLALGGPIGDIALTDYLPAGSVIVNRNVTYYNNTNQATAELNNGTDYTVTNVTGTLPDGTFVDAYMYNFTDQPFANWDGYLYDNDSITILYNVTVLGGGQWILPTIISGFDPQYQKHIKTEMYVSTSVPSFDISLETLTTTVAQGGVVKALLRMENVGGPTAKVDVLSTYAVKTMEGELITERSETFAVTDTKEKSLSLRLPQEIEPGMYTFEAFVTYTGREALTTDTFEVVGMKDEEGVADISYIYYTVIILVVVVMLLVAVLIRKSSKHPRRHKRRGMAFQ